MRPPRYSSFSGKTPFKFGPEVKKTLPPPQPAQRKPEWLRVRPPAGAVYQEVSKLLNSLNLSTVCREARCPNIGECWNGGTATVMLMGDVCSRGCRFCNVKTGNPRGRLDKNEPENTARAVARLRLNYVVLTSVDRDDLPDEGAEHFAKTVSRIKEGSPDLFVEVLTPDFSGRRDCLNKIVSAGPDVFAHNVETVERLSPKVRDPRAGYKQSLGVLEWVKKRSSVVYTKSSLMLGLGETKEEVLSALKDLRGAGCDVVTFGQYLRPARRHLPVQEYIPPAEFENWKNRALAMGFLYCASGPLVRSSYRAGEFFMKSLIEKQRRADGLKGN